MYKLFAFWNKVLFTHTLHTNVQEIANLCCLADKGRAGMYLGFTDLLVSYSCRGLLTDFEH